MQLLVLPKLDVVVLQGSITLLCYFIYIFMKGRYYHLPNELCIYLCDLLPL